MSKLNILYYNNYYLDNISETIKDLLIKINNNEDDFYYIFENDIKNIIKETNNDILKNIKTFDTKYNFMYFINEFLSYINNNNLNLNDIIMMPLFLYDNINNFEIININEFPSNYYIINYLPFILIKKSKKINEDNKELLLNYLEDYYKKLENAFNYIKRGNYFGIDYKNYLENYDIFYNKKNKNTNNN